MGLSKLRAYKKLTILINSYSMYQTNYKCTSFATNVPKVVAAMLVAAIRDLLVDVL